MIEIREDLQNQFINDTSNITFKMLERSYNKLIDNIEALKRRAVAIALITTGCTRCSQTHDNITDLLISDSRISESDLIDACTVLVGEDPHLRVTFRQTEEGSQISVIYTESQWQNWLDSHDTVKNDYTVFAGREIHIPDRTFASGGNIE